VVHLLVDVIVLLRVNICELTTGEYIKYSASPNKRWGDVGGGGGSIIQKKGVWALGEHYSSCQFSGCDNN
jgi:hypothetical protein